jgi:hypothetical protein
MRPVFVIASLLLASSAFAAMSAGQTQTTLSGQISDSLCKAKHEEAAEGAGKMTDHDCTVSCVKGGSKYVLLVDGKVIQIANQNQRDLETFAGQAVKVTGELKGDAITISAIVAR